jgi:hypothetical protein
MRFWNIVLCSRTRASSSENPKSLNIFGVVVVVGETRNVKLEYDESSKLYMERRVLFK